MIPYILTALGGYLIGSSVKQYASGGQVQLLAPNGKPSNLTPEQYKLVRTPEFKAWFGDWENDPENASKVVDENGEPLVVYHGTKADFSTFKSDFLIWVTSDFDYVKERIENEGRFNKHFELFCKSKNYLDLSSIGYKGISGKDFYEEIKNKYGVEIIELLSNENDFRRPYAFINTYSRSNFLKKYGFDGFKIAIDNKNFGIAVFNPEQVKLADGTNTTFDGSNPDIRYAEGGQVVSNDYNTGYNRNPDVNKGGNVIFYEYEDDDNRKKVESFWNDLHRQKIAKELGIYKINYRIYEDKIIALSSLYYTNYKSFKFTDNQISLIKELLNKYNLDFIKDYRLYENEIIINFVDGFRLKKKKSLFHDEKGEYRGYPYFYENLKIEDGKKYIGKMFKEVFGRHVDVPFSYKKEIRRYNDVLKRLAENNYSTEGRRKLDLSKAKQIEKYLDKYRYLAGFKLDSTGFIIAYEPFNE